MVEIRFELDRETKNTVRYAEVVDPGEPAVVGTLYVQKYAVERLGNPSSLTVTIAADVPAAV